MSYTENIINFGLSHYLDAGKHNAERMLLSVINHENIQDNTIQNKIPNGRNNGNSMIESFTNFSDDSTLGGARYVPEDKCPAGHTKHDEKCLQVCQHCSFRDYNNYSGREQFIPNKLCGPDAYFYGFDKDGYVTCKSK